MPRLREVPVHDSTRVRDTGKATDRAATATGRDPARTADAAPRGTRGGASRPVRAGAAVAGLAPRDRR
ncbi:hypothetical protein [Streptomyces sp. MAA16]|uniref:hypothetical protein n=1 Tax=Streptomyces sp. MAA16 TaxID=3035116 RepID=UPI002476D872|nr:hypothetical protein [Streptomyces sp. MAA16]MDH6697928.1 hypothetical protein [Streptomyces sp. MAA16]